MRNPRCRRPRIGNEPGRESERKRRSCPRETRAILSTVTLSPVSDSSVIRGGKTTTFTWVTDLPLDRSTVRAVMRCARRRWAIENETFKTLKSGDAHSFEHNYGHGDNHLRDVFGALAMPAFPVDQIQRHCRGPFGRALKHRERSLHLRDDPGDLVRGVAFPDRETLYRALAGEVGFVPVRDGPWRQRRFRASSPVSTLKPAKTVQTRPGQPLRTVAHARLKPANRHVD